MKPFKVSYSYPLEYPLKVVITKKGLLGFVGWLYQKYATRATWGDIIVTERILEVPTLHEWMGRLFKKPEGSLLEIGHVASHVSLELASMGFDVTAIDLRSYSFKHKKLTSLVGDFLKHDFGSKKFNAIFSLSTIEHFGFSGRYGGHDTPESTEDVEAFKKVSQLLAPGGAAIVTVPFAKEWCPGIWFRVYTRKEIEEKLGRFFVIEESRYYGRKNNEWSAANGSDYPASPHDGVALFLLRKKS